MEQQTYTITFEHVSMAEANRYASELRDTVLDASPDIKVEQQRNDTRTQDFGASVVLILGTPAVMALVKALGDWLHLRNSASLVLEKDGRIIAQNITSKDAAKLAELFMSQSK